MENGVSSNHRYAFVSLHFTISDRWLYMAECIKRSMHSVPRI